MAEINSPILLILGEYGQATRLYKYEKIFDNASIKVISKSNHFPMIDSPDEFTNIVCDFIDSQNL